MGEEILVALSSGFFAAEENKQHRPLVWPRLDQRARQLQNGDAAGCIIVGAIVDFVPIDRFADSQMVQVRAKQDNLILQPGIGTRENADYIVGCPLPGAAMKPEFAGNILDEPASVTSRLHAQLGQFRTNISGRKQFVARTTPASLKRIAGEEPKFSPNVVGKQITLPALLAKGHEGKTEDQSEKKFDGCFHLGSENQQYTCTL